MIANAHRSTIKEEDFIGLNDRDDEEFLKKQQEMVPLIFVPCLFWYRRTH